MDQQTEKDKTERVAGLGRRTREEIAKWYQMTTLRFHTGGRHRTSPASHQVEKIKIKITALENGQEEAKSLVSDCSDKEVK